MTWQPLLVGRSAEHALESAAEIGRALVAACSRVGEIDPRESILDRGDAGLAIACAYLHQAGLLDTAAPAEAFLERALEAIQQHEMDPTLMRGFTGIAWAAHHLYGDADPDADDPLDTIDEALVQLLAEGPELQHDLIEGTVGIGAYALSRLPRPAATAILEHVIARLARAAEQVPAGTTWLTPPATATSDPELYPEGSYVLGLGRGVPGIVALLAATYRRGIATERSNQLLDGAVAWLLAQRIDLPEAMFPIRTFPKPRAEPMLARPAWCFGDLGIAAALAIAARATAREDLRLVALEAARASAVSPLCDRGIADAGLCHGAGGLAHILNRIAQGLDDDDLRAHARTWYERTLAARRPGDYAGFGPAIASGVLDRDGRAGWSLLFGAGGVALALVASATDIPPAWDQILLVDPWDAPAG